jgi:hypothetical protein
MTRIAVLRQRAEDRIAAEETKDQGVALRESRVDRRATAKRAGMDGDDVDRRRAGSLMRPVEPVQRRALLRAYTWETNIPGMPGGSTTAGRFPKLRHG